MKIDKEKVIKALTDALSAKGNYRRAKAEMSFEFIEMLLELLKEQETVKPYIDIDEAKCPVCKVKLTRQELLGDDVLFEDFYDFCPRCGRRVVWGE